MSEKKSFVDKISDFASTVAAPIAKVAEFPAIASIQDGLLTVMPIIIVGSLFLILYVLGSPSVGNSGTALLPFLEPLAAKFAWMNSITMSFMSLYCSVTISESYAEKLEVNVRNAGILGLASFIIFTIGGLDEAGGIAVTAFSATGLFVCIITSLVSVKIYSVFIKKGFTIKLPDSVPPTIGNTFASLVPYAVCFTICWVVRTLLEFDMVAWLSGLLAPLVSGADNIFVAIVLTFFCMLLWSVGLHGDGMLLGFMTPFGTMWLEENAAALANGTSVYNLPHVLSAIGTSGLLRLTMWTAAVWPVVFLMFRSRVKYHKTLAVACLPSAIFTIVEPVIFGLPLALNPFLLIPFVLSGTIATGVGYALMATPFFGKFFAAPPWATPPFILGPLGTGDIKSLLIVILSFAIGMVIYLPFWRLYEKSCLDEERQQEEEAEA